MGNTIDPEVIMPNSSIVSITRCIDNSRTTILQPVGKIEDDIADLKDKVKQEASALITAATNILEDARKLEIKTDNTMLNATQLTVDIAPCIKRATQYKDSVTKGIKAAVKDIDGVFKRVIDSLEAASDTYRRKIVQYRKEQDDAAREVAKILEASNPPDVTKEAITPPTLAESKTVRMDSGQMSFTKKWTFTITNADAIPIEILRAAVKTAVGGKALESIIRQRVEGGIREISGVRIFETEQTTVRT